MCEATLFKRLIRGATHLGFLVLIALASPARAEPQMSDQGISDKIEDELLFDQGVVSSKVDVTTHNGVVTLTGDVNNLLAKERAARIAEAVRGVRSVVNRIAVSPSAFRPDTDVEEDIEAALLSDPATESFEVTASVVDGKVTLSGSVDSYREAELAAKVAKGVRGVIAVDSQIDVDYKTTRPDEEIRNDIKQAFRWNVHLDDFLIDVSVSDGKVQLSGTVGSSAEKRLAQAEAWVAGVSSVDSSSLKVEGWARDEKLRGDKFAVKTEEEIQSAVEAALLQDPRVKSFNVDVDAYGSTVTLRGLVDNLKAKRAAEQDARNTVGVTALVNRLKVRFDTPRLDTDIADDIRSALLRDPYVERFEITVNVVNGTAHLSGIVDSYYEKYHADEVASRIMGVVDVNNNLAVNDATPYLYDPYVDDGFVDREQLIEYNRRAPRMTDSQLKSEIESEMWWSPFVESDQVTVSVDNGIATLTGTVDTWGEYQAATENAYEGGATLVDNDLMVKYR